MKKLIIHLCADLGSDSYFYQQDENYEVVLVGKDIGVENFSTDRKVHGIIANPVCTEFSTASDFRQIKDIKKGMYLVNHCLRIIQESNPVWWVLENPFNGRLKEFIGKPKLIYQPWQFGSPWTKKTALWGNFNSPIPLYNKWEDVPKNQKLYIKPRRDKPGLDCLHKSAVNYIEEFKWAKDKIKTDADLRSMCSRGFAEQFYKANK